MGHPSVLDGWLIYDRGFGMLLSWKKNRACNRNTKCIPAFFVACQSYQNVMIDLFGSPIYPLIVIPVKAGIQLFQVACLGAMHQLIWLPIFFVETEN